MASTAQEALIAELLGDVGKLHDEVKALRESLPAVVAELSERTTAIHTAIAGLGDDAVQAAVMAHVENAAERSPLRRCAMRRRRCSQQRSSFQLTV
jgi:hypothetical protein